MAESDGLRQAYNIPAVAGTRPGYVYAKNRQQQKQGKKKRETALEPGKDESSSGDDGKHVDIKV
jgi:hypothetical protein